MVVLESRSHADLQIVGQLLPSVLEHALRVVPIVRGRRERATNVITISEQYQVVL